MWGFVIKTMPGICLTYICVMLGQNIHLNEVCYAAVINIKISVVFA